MVRSPGRPGGPRPSGRSFFPLMNSLPPFPHIDPISQIHSKNHDGGSPDGCLAAKNVAVPTEMFVPRVIPRVIQADDSSGSRIDTGEVWAFEAVAVPTRQGEVLRDRFSPVSGRNDVINLERGKVEALRGLTEFASETSSVPDELTQARIHQRLPVRLFSANNFLAWARRMERKLPTRP